MMKNNLNHLLLLFAFLLAIVPVQAQDDDDWGDFGEEEIENAKISGGIIHVPFEYQFTDMAPLNQSLDAAGFSSLRDEVLGYGSDLTVFVRNFVLSAGTRRSFTQKTGNNTVDMSLTHRQTEFGAGYVLYASNGFIAYPRALFGWSNQELQTQVRNGSTDFSSGIQGTFLGSEMERKSYYIGADIGADYMFGFDETSGSGINLGLRVGYQYQLDSGDWSSYGQTVTDGPNIDLSGLFIRASIGFAGWHRQ